MTTQNLLPEESLPRARMAVLDGSRQRRIATVVLAGQVGGQITLSVLGDQHETNAISTAAQEAAAGVPSNGQPLAERLAQLRDAICSRLLADGFHIEGLPAADISLAIEFDIKSGRVIGRPTALHDFATVDQGLVRDLHAAVAKVFEKGPIELAAQIESLVDAEDHIAAAEAIKAGRQGLGFSGVLPPKLNNALQRISVSSMDPDTRKMVRESRMAVAAALGDYDAAEHDASALLTEIPFTDKAKRAPLQNVIAVASAKRGEVETALSIWRELLKRPEDLEPRDRAWVWRNFSMALPASGSEAIAAARLSVDAFLEAGDKREAATGLMHISHLLERESPSSALKQLDGMLEIITQNGLMGEELRAAIYHGRGNRLNELRDYSGALEAALKAVQLRRGVSGVENELISSLHLASIVAMNDGNVELAGQLDAEAQTLETKTESSWFNMARRIGDLASKFDREAADAVLADVRALGNTKLMAAASVVVTTSDPELDATSRLRQLEGLLRNLERDNANDDIKQPVLLAVAHVLRAEGQYGRAATWLRQVLDSDPIALDVRDMLIDCLWRENDWGNAAIFLKAQISLHGEAPGLLYAYGRSLVEAGDLSSAIPILSKALKLLNANDELYKRIEAIREHALELGGTVPNPPPVLNTQHPILSSDLEQALHDFAHFIAADKRMGFWTRHERKEDYTWIDQPEKRAQDLLHTFLKARFQTKISLFEELDTGAGRLDLLLQLAGGLSVIIELKMCGFGYSSTYAASGEGQIRHYMENRSCHLGYLVVHDARLEDYGSQLIYNSTEGPETINEIFVDVRPRVSSRRTGK